MFKVNNKDTRTTPMANIITRPIFLESAVDGLGLGTESWEN